MAGTRANPYDVDEVLFDAQDDDDVRVITQITVDDDSTQEWRRQFSTYVRHYTNVAGNTDPPGHHMLFMYPSDSEDEILSYTCPAQVDSEDEIELC